MAARICWNESRGAMTSAIWKVMDRLWRTILHRSSPTARATWSSTRVAPRRAGFAVAIRPVSRLWNRGPDLGIRGTLVVAALAVVISAANTFGLNSRFPPIAGIQTETPSTERGRLSVSARSALRKALPWARPVRPRAAAADNGRDARDARGRGAGRAQVTFVLEHRGRSRTVLRVLRVSSLLP